MQPAASKSAEDSRPCLAQNLEHFTRWMLSGIYAIVLLVGALHLAIRSVSLLGNREKLSQDVRARHAVVILELTLLTWLLRPIINSYVQSKRFCWESYVKDATSVH